jgi:hypothetical protein
MERIDSTGIIVYVFNCNQIYIIDTLHADPNERVTKLTASN